MISDVQQSKQTLNYDDQMTIQFTRIRRSSSELGLAIFLFSSFCLRQLNSRPEGMGRRVALEKCIFGKSSGMIEIVDESDGICLFRLVFKFLFFSSPPMSVSGSSAIFVGIMWVRHQQNPADKAAANRYKLATRGDRQKCVYQRKMALRLRKLAGLDDRPPPYGLEEIDQVQCRILDRLNIGVMVFDAEKFRGRVYPSSDQLRPNIAENRTIFLRLSQNERHFDFIRTIKAFFRKCVFSPI